METTSSLRSAKWLFWIGSLSLISAVRAQTHAPDAPEALRPANDQSLIAHWTGKGKQIYVCQQIGTDYAWKLKAPDAQLFNNSGKLAGHHFAGPTWKASDGSSIIGQMTASVPAPEAGSIPWLLLAVKSHAGTGILSTAQNVQRLHTKGGVAPANGCAAMTVKTEISVPYEADYYFYAAVPVR